MKINAVCGSLLGTVAVAYGVSALAATVDEGGNSSMSVVQVSKGSSEQFSKLINDLRAGSNSSDAVLRRISIQALDSMTSGNVRTFEVQHSRKLAQAEDLQKAESTPNPGDIFTYTTCSTDAGHQSWNTTITEVWSQDATSGTWLWKITDSHTWRVTGCPVGGA